jgi:hypothetical protein
MPHQYNAGDVVTVFQISPSNELVIEGKATIRYPKAWKGV